MKKSLLILSVILIAFSCSNPPSEDYPKLRQSIAESFGIAIERVVFYDSVFIVDGDAYVSLEDAKMRFEKRDQTVPGTVNEPSQRFSNYKVSPSIARNIKVYCDPSVPSEWVRAIDSSNSKIDSLHSGLKFVRQESSAGANIKVTTMSAPNNVIAMSSYPDYYGRPGKKVTINTVYNKTSFDYKVYALSHELLHAAGFSHTDGTYGNIVKNTPLDDPMSVMNATAKNWRGWTQYDYEAVKTVYPR